MLYTLLIAERYGNSYRHLYRTGYSHPAPGVQVPAGLLYYTQSEEVIQVPATRNELRGLVIARNELASYITRRRTSLAQSTGEEELLPPTIDDEWSCGRCYAVDGCMLYRKVSIISILSFTQAHCFSGSRTKRRYDFRHRSSLPGEDRTSDRGSMRLLPEMGGTHLY